MRERLAAAPDGVPRCDCGEPLKPDVVLFGELLPERAFARAQALAATAALLLCIGSSLEVHPVASAPRAHPGVGRPRRHRHAGRDAVRRRRGGQARRRRRGGARGRHGGAVAMVPLPHVAARPPSAHGSATIAAPLPLPDPFPADAVVVLRAPGVRATWRRSRPPTATGDQPLLVAPPGALHARRRARLSRGRRGGPPRRGPRARAGGHRPQVGDCARRRLPVRRRPPAGTAPRW